MRSNITLGEIVDRTTHAGFGFLAALLALVAIPFVGLSTPFGLTIAAVGGQMIAGRKRPWLPRRLRRHLVAMSTLEWIGRNLVRWTHWLERLVRPRFMLMSRGPFWILLGLGIILQGLGLALPLPIPGSNWPFIIVILVYAIGLLEADGILIMLGHTITALMLLMAVFFWHEVHGELLRAWHWMVGRFF